MAEEIVNRVAKSPLVTFNLEDYYHQGERIVLDIKDQLYQGMILREKDFREFVKSQDWSLYEGKNVAITCSVDAVVPTWAYMLLSIQLAPYAHTVVYGGKDDLENCLFQKALSGVDVEEFRDKKVVIKGCSKYDVPASAYVEIVRMLQPVVMSLMYGEPCSTVPLYKKKKSV
jgi:hypothetical protein